jgi:hypothetical protein
MPPLATSLHGPLNGIFERLLEDASATARQASRGVDEVDWIEKLHALIGVSLDRDLRAATRASGSAMSVAAHSMLVHGNPFQVRPTWPHSGTIEIGDLLVVSDVVEEPDSLERQALLLQIKVGEPRIGKRVVWTTAQAKLYATWPPITWSNEQMLKRLRGPFPRTPTPGPSRAAQFGVVPSRAEARHMCAPRALQLVREGVFASPTSLADEIASTLRLDIGVDATPDGGNGWPRIVDDILREAGLRDFRDLPRYISGYLGPPHRTRRRGQGGPMRPMLAVQATFGPQGWFD